MSRNRDWCKVFESRTVADVSYSDWRPVTVAGVKYLKIRVTRRQSRIFDGHCTRPLATISVTGHLRILSYVALSGQVGKINHPPFISETTRSYTHPWCIISFLLCVYLRNPRSFTQRKGPKRISVRTNEDVRGCRRGNRIILRRQTYQEQFFLQQDVLHSGYWLCH